MQDAWRLQLSVLFIAVNRTYNTDRERNNDGLKSDAHQVLLVYTNKAPITSHLLYEIDQRGESTGEGVKGRDW